MYWLYVMSSVICSVQAAEIPLKYTPLPTDVLGFPSAGSMFHCIAWRSAPTETVGQHAIKVDGGTFQKHIHDAPLSYTRDGKVGYTAVFHVQTHHRGDTDLMTVTFETKDYTDMRLVDFALAATRWVSFVFARPLSLRIAN